MRCSSTAATPRSNAVPTGAAGPRSYGGHVRAMAVVNYAQPLAQIDFPEPELLPGEALVEVLTCGVCFSDVKTSRGLMAYSAELPLPHVPGHEICGRVLETTPAGALPPGTLVVVYHYWPCGRCRRCRAGE